MTGPQTADAAGLAPSSRAAGLALVACLTAGFTTLLDQSVVNLALPSMAESLRASAAEVQWFVASYSLTFGLALVPSGRIGDIRGRRRLFLAGFLLFGVGSIASGLAPVAPVVVLARLLQGFGAGVVNAQVFGTIQDLFDGLERGRTIALYSVFGGVAGVLGPLVAGLLVATLPLDVGWRAVVALSAPLALATFVLGARWLPRGPVHPHPPGERPRLDAVGLGLLAVATLGLLLPMIRIGLPGPVRVGLVAVAVAAAAVFVRWERHSARRDPAGVIMHPDLLRAPGFVVGTLIATFWFGAQLAHTTVTTLFLLGPLHVPAFTVALVFVPSSITMSLSAFFGWRLVSRYGMRLLTYAIGLMVAIEATLALTLPHADKVGAVALLVSLNVVSGAAGGMTDSVNRAQTLLQSPASARGVAAGFLQLAQRLSATVCIAAATGIALSGGGAVVSRHGLGLALGLCAALFAVSGVVSLRRTGDPTTRPLPSIALSEESL